MKMSENTISKFGRFYTFLNPDASKGPGTWRLSSIDEYSGSGGGGTGTLNEVDGILPVVTETVAPGEIDVSIDISRLDEKP